MFMTRNRCVPVKNMLGSNVVVSCACELIPLFSVVVNVVRVVYKFDFGHVNQTLARSQASAAVELDSFVFWDTTQCRF